MEQLEIRDVIPADFEYIYEFINILEGTIFEKESQRLIFIENISNVNNVFLIALLNNKAIGFLSCHVQNLMHHGGLVGEIEEMFVHKDYRNLKVGHQLIDRLKQKARKKQILQLEVTSNNKRVLAHQFYENEGFRQTHYKFVFC